MKRENWLTAAGLGVLAVCYVIAFTSVIRPRGEEVRSDGRVVVRLAHWQLEAGLREAFDVLASDCERMNPGVVIEQLTIPDRAYTSWIRTQLIGGTAPDLLQLGRGTDDSTLARFFHPIGLQVGLPNPYNEGTPMAGVAWKDTFIDGLTGSRSYNPNLMEYYGVPSSVFTVRMFYNRTLWRSLLGDTPPPRDYGEFIRICEQVQKEVGRRGMNIVPIASSKEQAPLLLGRLFGSQTQRLSLRLDTLNAIEPRAVDVGLAYLRGDWGMESPEITDGLGLLRDVSRFMQPGFMQLARDDATFYFVQSRALMITTGSWDGPSFRSQADFEIGAFAVPLPQADHPVYGRGLLGPANEGYGSVGLVFGVAQQSPHKKEAIAFLQFLTSQKGNRRFSDVSGWLPSVERVPLSPELEPFTPVTDGYPDGFDLTLKNLGADTRRVVETQLAGLLSPQVELAAARAQFDGKLKEAVRADLVRSLRQSAETVRRQDIMAIAAYMLGEGAPEEKVNEIFENQTYLESMAAWTRLGLDRAGGD